MNHTMDYKQVIYIPDNKLPLVQEVLPQNYTITWASGYWKGGKETTCILTQYGYNTAELNDTCLAIVKILLASGEEAVLVESTLVNATLIDDTSSFH